nr:MAG TPA: hypothetical protein [Caudoviricetes sp.]
MDSYKKIVEDIRDWSNNKAVFCCRDSEDLHKRKMILYKEHKIAKDQAIHLEKLIDNIIMD